jgi:hypothetical protein
MSMTINVENNKKKEPKEDLLKGRSKASDVAALIFLFESLPSDGGVDGKAKIIEKVESLAKAFERRLTFTAIGIGDIKELGMLQRMVDAAKECTSMSVTVLTFTFSLSNNPSFPKVSYVMTTQLIVLPHLADTPFVVYHVAPIFQFVRFATAKELL